MPVPAPKLDLVDVDPDSSPRYPREVKPEPHEAVFRTTLGDDGRVVVEQLPLTLDVLLDPREEDQVTQSKGHQRKLNPLADTFVRFLERQEDLAVCSDLLILWKKMGERDVSPDLCVFRGVRDRDAIDRSYDPEDQGVLAPCLVIEVVSDSTEAMASKDEEENPELFARMGVEDLVWLYPPRSLKTGKLHLVVSRLDRSGPRYRRCFPGPGGWFVLSSVGLRIKLSDDRRRLVIEDVKTGERLLTSVEEEAARRAAEQRADQEARRAEQEADARRAAEERHIEDLCAVLGIEWSAARKSAVEAMSSSRLEALRTHLVREKNWPKATHA